MENGSAHSVETWFLLKWSTAATVTIAWSLKASHPSTEGYVHSVVFDRNSHSFLEMLYNLIGFFSFLLNAEVREAAATHVL